MRSKLFVPGHRPELFPKALASAADALSFDLEDAVPAERKAHARASVTACVRSEAARQSGKVMIVRVNALDSAYFEADIAALSGLPLDLLNLPKVESADVVRVAIVQLQRANADQAIAAPTRLLLNIETPRGLRNAASIAGADACVAGLQLGLGDLFEPFGIARTDMANVHAAMFAMRLAAAEAGVFAVDAAFADIADEDGYRAEAAMAARLGYVGKTCIHPRQVALANAAFAASADDIEAARRIVASARDAAARGAAAFVVDGRMIDPPFLRRAEAIVAAADRAAGDGA